VAIISGGKLQEVAQVHELTERGASRVEVTIRGLDDDAIAVVHDSPPILRQGGDVTWSVDDSERADALVRAGHREGGSVMALRPRRETLEQLFLKDAGSITAVTP
jgi:hypothetical protein